MSFRGRLSRAPFWWCSIALWGEKRLSDFLLFECAYAELYFTDCSWPDFDACAFNSALNEFAKRERRFGRLGSRTGEVATHGIGASSEAASEFGCPPHRRCHTAELGCLQRFACSFLPTPPHGDAVAA
jgi:hypothetical protein